MHWWINKWICIDSITIKRWSISSGSRRLWGVTIDPSRSTCCGGVGTFVLRRRVASSPASSRRRTSDDGTAWRPPPVVGTYGCFWRVSPGLCCLRRTWLATRDTWPRTCCRARSTYMDWREWGLSWLRSFLCRRSRTVGSTRGRASVRRWATSCSHSPDTEWTRCKPLGSRATGSGGLHRTPVWTPNRF